MHSSLKKLVPVSLLATTSAAAFINTSISTNSSGVKAHALLKNESTATSSSDEKAYANASLLGIPSPDTTPDFDYNFNIIFKGGKCSASQEATILKTFADIAGLSDRIKLWENDLFHDWQPEVKYWFGENPQSKDAWIKSNGALFPPIDLVVDVTVR